MNTTPHLPVLDLLFQAPGVVLVHLAAAGAALLTGAVVLFARKGTPGHRRLGRAWVLLMLAVALSSFFIQRRGHFGPIHALSLLMTASLAWGVYRARLGRFRSHRLTMLSCYLSLWIAGAFTLLPHRLLGHLLVA